jgi:hypothetical protein
MRPHACRYSSAAYKTQLSLATVSPPLPPYQRELLEALVLQDRRCKEVTSALAQAIASSHAAAQEYWSAQLRAHCCPAPSAPKPAAAAKAAAASAAAAQPDVLVLRCNGLEQEFGWVAPAGVFQCWSGAACLLDVSCWRN